MTALSELKRHLRPGQVYRRADLAHRSNAVDRHLQQLLADGTLNKVSRGLYSCPKQASFGEVPPEDEKLVSAFLKSDDFLMFSPNQYNSLGVGATQLYNTVYVYNRKRHGRYKLGNREYEFKVKPYFPKKLDESFLLVDLLNNVDRLAEDKHLLLEKSKRAVERVGVSAFKKAADTYGKVGTKKLVSAMLSEARQ